MKLTNYLLFFTLLFANVFAKALPPQSLNDTSFSSNLKKLPKFATPIFKKNIVTITQFNAKGDGITLNTTAINNAIAACNKKGGGTVVIPQGLWLTGPIEFKNNINLRLDKGAVVIFTDDFNQYPLVKSSFEGVEAARCKSPIAAENLSNIAITGDGIFDGNGNAWRPLKKSKVTDSEWKRLIKKGVVSEDNTWYPSASALKGSVDKNIGKLDGKQINDFENVKDFLRPNMVRFVNCKNILLEGVTFQNSPAWTLHMMMSQQITINNVRVKNPWNAQNTDGIDLESCKNVQLQNSIFDTGDDGICIKSGRDEEGRKRGMPTENVLVNNCTVYHAHGGFVVGSEMSGGAKNLFVSNCTFIGTDIGLRFKTTRGRGGIVENIYANNIQMKDILGEAILFDMYYMAKDPVPPVGEKLIIPTIETMPINEGTPIFRNFYFKNIVCSGAEKAIFIRGIPEMNIKNINIENAIIQSDKGIYCEEANGVNLKNITVLSKNTDPVVVINNSNNLIVDKFIYTNNAKLLLSINGERTNNIKVTNTDFTKANKEAVFGDNVSESVLSKK